MALATYRLLIESPAVEFIEHLIRKETHISFFYDAVDLWFQVEPKESGERKVTMNINGNLTSGAFKTAKATFTTGKDKTTKSLDYTFKFELIDGNIRLRDAKIINAKIVESLLAYILLSDLSYNRNLEPNSIDAGYPADECFNHLYNAYKVDELVKIGEVDWQKRTFTMSFINAPSTLCFKTVNVTITIIPNIEGSRVKWTIKVENIIEDTEESESVAAVALAIRDIIQNKFRK